MVTISPHDLFQHNSRQCSGRRVSECLADQRVDGHLCASHHAAGVLVQAIVAHDRGVAQGFSILFQMAIST